MISSIRDDKQSGDDALDDALEDNQELLEDLDSKFFAYPDDLPGLLFAFVAQNPTEFGSVPT